MVYTKRNYKSPGESNFPPVDIEQDASLSIGEILYNVAHGLPTGIKESYLEYDDEDSNPSEGYEDIFERADAVMNVVQSDGTDEQSTVDGAPSGTSSPPAVESEANTESEASTAGE